MAPLAPDEHLNITRMPEYDSARALVPQNGRLNRFNYFVAVGAKAASQLQS
jgi:hypothetical protein